jgi:tetratricopeptide (TPR) repeat protein
VAMRVSPGPGPADPADEAAVRLASPYDDPSPLTAPAWGSERRAVLGIAALAAAISFALPGIAARYTSAAYDDFQKDPAKTLARLERASDLDPLSAEPLLAKGLIAQRLGQRSVASDALRRAIDREPDNWFAHFELALVDASSGHPAAAQASLMRATSLNPRQPLLALVRQDLAAGRRPDEAMIDRSLYSQVRKRLTSTQQRSP